MASRLTPILITVYIIEEHGRRGYEQRVHTQNEKGKPAVVACPHAIIDPRAMMIKSFDTVAAEGAMS
jgi:hypothetical protein